MDLIIMHKKAFIGCLEGENAFKPLCYYFVKFVKNVSITMQVNTGPLLTNKM